MSKGSSQTCSTTHTNRLSINSADAFKRSFMLKLSLKWQNFSENYWNLFYLKLVLKNNICFFFVLFFKNRIHLGQ